MSDAARTAVLEAHCRELKLPSVRRHYPELVRQAAHDGWNYEEFLLQLLESEVLARHDGAVARLLRQARFPRPQDPRAARLGGAAEDLHLLPTHQFA